MQIHFYDQWDKQSQGKMKKRKIASFEIIHKLKWLHGKWGNRILIVCSVFCALLFSYLIFADHNGQAMHADQTVIYAKPSELMYTVRQGDTLWSIAQEHYPEKKEEEAIALIQKKNGLQGSIIHAGQSILLP